MLIDLLFAAAMASVDVRTGTLTDIVGAGDFNGDGAPDLLQNYQNYGVVPLYNDGAGVMAPGPLYAYPHVGPGCQPRITGGPGESVVADRNGDGFDDIFVFSSNGDECYFSYTTPGGPAGLFTGLTSPVSQSGGLFDAKNIGDIDGNGTDDLSAIHSYHIYLCDWYGTEYWCDETGYEFVILYTRYPMGYAVQWPTGDSASIAGDNDGDGRADLLFSGTREIPVSWAPGPSTGYLPYEPSWTLAPRESASFGTTGDHGYWVQGVGDVDLDGFGDMILYSQDVTTWMSWFAGRPWGFDAEPSGRLLPPPLLSLDKASARADFDGDGVDEVVLIGRGVSGGWLLFYHPDVGDQWPLYAFPTAISEAPYPVPEGVTNIGDVDGAGLDDLLVNGTIVLAPDCPGGPPTTWFTDDDGDGQGDGTLPVLACEPPSGATTVVGDCDDSDARVFSGSTQDVPGVDADCDGWVLGWQDLDRDGVAGTPDWIPYQTVFYPYRATGGDCNDADRTVYPGAYEPMPATRDLNCDGMLSCYADQDGDGAGVAVLATTAGTSCDDPAAGVANDAEDCDDDDPLLVGQRYRPDADGDGFGGGLGVIACVPPAGYIAVGGDCNDGRADVSPLGVEVLGGADENCDGFGLCYRDNDRDSFGSELVELGPPSGCYGTWSEVPGDCDDSSSRARPGGVEVVDRWDNDCDGIWQCYRDDDFDGSGDEVSDGAGSWVSVLVPGACAEVPGTAWQAGDCDPTDPSVHDGATEVAGGVDEDCDGGYICFSDYDGDGHGKLPETSERSGTCESRPGKSSVGDDCDDSRSSVHPGAPELPGGGDDNCDGLWLCVLDEDGDGSGGAAEEQGTPCSTTRTVPNEDCDDADPGTHPGAEEPMFVDRDCDGRRTCFRDGDSDGFGSRLRRTTTRPSCAEPAHALADNALDCDDSRADVRPGAVEVPFDGVDDDCDGQDTFRIVARSVGGGLDVRLSGAPPGTPLRLYASRTGTGAEPCVPGGVCGELASPREVAAGLADAAGSLQVRLPLPSGAPEVWLQGFAYSGGTAGRSVVSSVRLTP